MSTCGGVCTTWSQVLTYGFGRLFACRHVNTLSHRRRFVYGLTLIGFQGDQPARSYNNLPATRFVYGLSSGSCVQIDIRLQIAPAYCLWSCFQCTPLICNSPLSDRCVVDTTRFSVQSALTASPPMIRGQQPDSRLMISMSFGICWLCQPAADASAGIQVQSPYL